MSLQQIRTKKHQMKLEESQVQKQEKEVGLHICNSAAETSGSTAQMCTRGSGQIQRTGIYQELLNTQKPHTEQISQNRGITEGPFHPKPF